MSATKFAFQLLSAGIKSSQGTRVALQRTLDRYSLRTVRPDLSWPDESRQRCFNGTAYTNLLPIEASARFAEFQDTFLYEWRKSAAYISEEGVATTEYTGKIAPLVPLTPLTWHASQVQGAARRRPDGNGLIEARVTYRYHVRFTICRAKGAGLTRLQYHLTELPDPSMSCGYDLVRHFEAPPMPTPFGHVGERFLRFCATAKHPFGE
jgi:hypothetical protein